jgi:hypothetical protein
MGSRHCGLPLRLPVGELLLPFALLGPMAPEDDIDLLVNAWEGVTTAPPIAAIVLVRFILFVVGAAAVVGMVGYCRLIS